MHLTLALLAPLALSAAAPQTPSAARQPATRTLIEVTPAGAFERVARSTLARAVAPPAGLTAAGSQWSHPDGGLAWIARDVALGNQGSQVFCEYDLNNEAAVLLSVYDAHPPSEVWNDGAALGTEFRDVASAHATDTHVSVHQVLLGGSITTRQAVLRKYSSSSASPDWSYTFAPVINAASKVAISRDGQTIVAMIFNDGTADVEIAVFAPGSGTPQSYTVVPVGSGNFLRGFDLSADGSSLYFSAGVTAHVFDVATQTVVFTANIGASFDSHAISGDGAVLAFGNFNLLRVYERQGASYSPSFDVNLPGTVYCARIDLSDDGSTLAAGWYEYTQGLTVTVQAHDVPSKSQTMSETVTGTGGFQNVVADVSCAADGARFALGLWGDQGDQAHEVRLYARDQNAPLLTLNTPGSVFDVDLAPDGQRVLAGTKAVHANTFGNGGSLELVDAGGEDLTLRGTPSIGSTPLIEYHGSPGDAAILLSSAQAAVPPLTFTGVGTLYLDKAFLAVTPMGTLGAGGVLSYPRPIPDNPALIGLVQYHQVLALPQRSLSADWFKLTVLP